MNQHGPTGPHGIRRPTPTADLFAQEHRRPPTSTSSRSPGSPTTASRAGSAKRPWMKVPRRGTRPRCAHQRPHSSTGVNHAMPMHPRTRPPDSTAPPRSRREIQDRPSGTSRVGRPGSCRSPPRRPSMASVIQAMPLEIVHCVHRIAQALPDPVNIPHPPGRKGAICYIILPPNTGEPEGRWGAAAGSLCPHFTGARTSLRSCSWA